jgi:hypothetical protein
LWNLAARLEAAPFQNGLQTAFFRKLLKRCAIQNRLFQQRLKTCSTAAKSRALPKTIYETA